MFIVAYFFKCEKRIKQKKKKFTFLKTFSDGGGWKRKWSSSPSRQRAVRNCKRKIAFDGKNLQSKRFTIGK